MDIFLDTANVDEIREAHDLGILDGVTTNPTLVAREGKDFATLIQEIFSIVDGPVLAEVISVETEGMVKEAKELAKIHQNIVVKIPLIKDGLKAVKALKDTGIKLNMTLCFSPNQALLAAKAGAAYVSPLIGRLDDITHIGMDQIRDIRCIYDNYGFETKIIAASIRNPIHVLESALAGADLATMPFAVLEKMVKHPLTDIGLKKFLDDWKKVPKQK